MELSQLEHAHQLMVHGKLMEAEAFLTDSLKQFPIHQELLRLMGKLMQHKGEPEKSLGYWFRLLGMYPNDGIALGSMIESCMVLKNPEKALQYIQNLELVGKATSVHLHHLGVLYARLGMIEKGFDLLLKAYQLDPTDESFLAAVLFFIYAVPDLTPEQIFYYYQKAGELIEKNITPLPMRPLEPKAPGERLRIGYLSGDFKDHSAAHEYAIWFEFHDRQQFEIFLYDADPTQDPLADWFRQHADKWCDVSGLSDEQAARQIQADQIDILMDLSSHTQNGRLGILAYKPAPIQITGKGYGRTSGLKRIDYRLTDFGMTPPELKHYNTEQLAYLTNLFFWAANDTMHQLVSEPPPCLKNGCVTFGYSNAPFKLNQPLLECWAEILNQVPNSRLYFKYMTFEVPFIQNHIRNVMGAKGITAERLVFFGGTDVVSHYQWFNQIDIALDPFPYNGGVSTLDALWMGRPVVCLAGGSRSGVSIYNALDHHDLLAKTPNHYIRRAVQLAKESHAISDYQKELRNKILESPLSDGRFATAEIESLYLRSWQAYQDITTIPQSNRLLPELVPDSVPGMFAFARQLLRAEYREEAQQVLLKLVEKDPHPVLPSMILAQLDVERRQFRTAETHLLKALSYSQDNVQAMQQLGSLYQTEQRLPEAIATFEKALTFQPTNLFSLEHLAQIYKEQGNYTKSLKYARQALADKADDYSSLKIALESYWKLRQYQQAYDLIHNTFAQYPDNALFHYQMAYFYYFLLGRIDTAYSLLEKAIEMEPENKGFLEGMLFISYSKWGLSPEKQFSFYKRWGQLTEEEETKVCTTWTNTPDPLKKLKIGYVGGDFRRHSAIHDYRTLFNLYDRQNFDYFIYDTAPSHDDMGQWFYKRATQAHDVSGMSTDDLVKLIQQDQIDILIDLSSHTQNNRLDVFARKPAPIQMTGRGYGSTSGLTRIDYRFTDRATTPPELEPYNSEKLVFLPSRLFWTVDTLMEQITIEPPPVMVNGYITFGYNNAPFKLTPYLIETWCAILQQVPHSRLQMKYTGLDIEIVNSYYIELFQKHGIDSDRLTFIGESSAIEHYRSYNQVDIVLDPFPYNGGVSTMEALWMGRPVIALADGTRSGACVLTAIGDTRLLAQTPTEYIQMAVDLAQNIAHIEDVNQNMRQRMLASHLCNGHEMVQATEVIFKDVWRKWCLQHANSHSLLQQAQAALDNRNWSAAENLFRSILEQNPNHPQALHGLGMVAYECGHADAAVSLLQQALALMPKNPHVHLHMGMILTQLKRIPEATQSLQQALQLEPGLDIAQQALAQLGGQP